MPFQLLIIRLITIEPNSRTIREVRHYVRVNNINLFCCLTTKSLDVDRDVSIAYCKSSSGDGVDWRILFLLRSIETIDYKIPV